MSRLCQDQRWSGEAHDGAHSTSQWAAILTAQVAKVAKTAVFGTKQEFLLALVDVGAVAQAAYEYNALTLDETQGAERAVHQQLRPVCSMCRERSVSAHGVVCGVCVQQQIDGGFIG